jgi:hypothetical protein
MELPNNFDDACEDPVAFYTNAIILEEPKEFHIRGRSHGSRRKETFS